MSGRKFSILRPDSLSEPKVLYLWRPALYPGVELSIRAHFSRDILLQKLGGGNPPIQTLALQNTLGLRILMVEEILDEPRKVLASPPLGLG